jgi:hypothetical protein
MVFPLGNTNLALFSANLPAGFSGWTWRDTNAPRFTASLLEWSRCGAIAFTNRDQFSRWLAEHPAIDECYRGALQNPDGIGAKLAGGLEPQLAPQSLLLATYPLWLAQESERLGRTTEAFDHLLAGWRLWARAAACRGVEQGSFWALARSWRRLALTGPPLEAGEAQRLLNALTGATNLLPALETAYAQRAVPDGVAEPGPGPEGADWGELGEAFKEGLRRIGREAELRAERLAAGLVGKEVREDWELKGIRHLAEPFEALLLAGQQTSARDEDFRQIRTAYFSQVLARLHQGKLREADQFDAALRAAHPGSGLKEFFDRPAVWRCFDSFESPSRALDSLIRWRCGLETCRLTLALRLYRDRHGAWPERLEELVPELLPALPVEPCSGQPFRYQKKGETWLIRAGMNHYAVRLPGRMDIDLLRRYGLMPKAAGPELDVPVQRPLCSSEEVKQSLVAWEARQGVQFPGMDIRMMARYGLLPKGFRLTTSNTLVAVPASPPATGILAATNFAGRAATNQGGPKRQAR